jgi:hypothetical protein
LDFKYCIEVIERIMQVMAGNATRRLAEGLKDIIDG